MQENTARKRFQLGRKAKKDIIIVGILILVGFSAFGLGRLSANETYNGLEAKDAVFVPQVDLVPLHADSALHNGSIVASKNGSKYHFPWCGGAQRINAENLIYFENIEHARTAGYLPAKNCKGLK